MAKYVSDEDVVAFTFWLPRRVLKAVHHVAIDQNKSRGVVIRETLEAAYCQPEPSSEPPAS